jgi:hypothetical protein
MRLTYENYTGFGTAGIYLALAISFFDNFLRYQDHFYLQGLLQREKEIPISRSCLGLLISYIENSKY